LSHFFTFYLAFSPLNPTKPDSGGKSVDDNSDDQDQGPLGSSGGSDDEVVVEKVAGGIPKETPPASSLKLSDFGGVDSTLTTASTTAWSTGLPGLSTPQSLLGALENSAEGDKGNKSDSNLGRESGDDQNKARDDQNKARATLSSHVRNQQIELFQHSVAEDFKGAEDVFQWIQSMDDNDPVLQKFLPILFYEGGGDDATEESIQGLIQKIQASIEEIEGIDFANVLNQEPILLSGFIYVFHMRATLILRKMYSCLVEVAKLKLPEFEDLTWMKFAKAVNCTIEDPPKNVAEKVVGYLKGLKHKWEVLILVVFAVYVRKMKGGGGILSGVGRKEIDKNAGCGVVRDLSLEEISESLTPWHWEYPAHKMVNDITSATIDVHLSAEYKKHGKPPEEKDENMLDEYFFRISDHFPLAEVHSLGLDERMKIYGTDEINDKPHQDTHSFLSKFNVLQTHFNKTYFFEANYQKLIEDFFVSKNRSQKWIPKDMKKPLEEANEYYTDHAVCFEDYQPAAPFLPPTAAEPTAAAAKRNSSGVVEMAPASKKPRTSSKGISTSSVTPKISNKDAAPATTGKGAASATTAKAKKTGDPLGGLGRHIQDSKKARDMEIKKQKENDEKLRKEKEERTKKLVSSAKKNKEKDEEDEEDPQALLQNKKDKSTPRRQRNARSGRKGGSQK
jgi:hypothetical protein